MVGVRNHIIMEKKEERKILTRWEGLDITHFLQVIYHLFDQRDPDWGEFQAGLAYRFFHTNHVCRFFVYSLPTVYLNLQNLGFMPGYLLIFLECMLGKFQFI
jgi:hypothetical protein